MTGLLTVTRPLGGEGSLPLLPLIKTVCASSQVVVLWLRVFHLVVGTFTMYELAGQAHQVIPKKGTQQLRL